MSAKSNNYGRAYEFACLQVLVEILRPFREVSVEVNSSYEAAAEAWKKVPKKLQANLLASSRAAVEVLLDCEALLAEGRTLFRSICKQIPTAKRAMCAILLLRGGRVAGKLGLALSIITKPLSIAAWLLLWTLVRNGMELPVRNLIGRRLNLSLSG